MKIVHIITNLGDGGAENTLYKICKYDFKNTHIVISLRGAGKYYSLLCKLGIEVHYLNMNFFSINKFFSIIKFLQNSKPDIVQTWLVHADFIGGISSRLAGIDNIVWNIRYSNLEIGKAKITTILLSKLLAKLSFSIPKLIIINSKNAKKIHEKNGYCKKKMSLIYNGFDLSLLKFNKNQNFYFNKKFKINKKIPIIGLVARYDPMKDHRNLFSALTKVKKDNINFIMVLIGSNVNKNNNELMSMIKKFELTKYVKLLGPTTNVTQVMNGIDIHVLSSQYGEGFPNVVAEAMACKTPCIVTNLGDAASIVGGTGWIVPIKNSNKLAKAIKQSLLEINTKKWKKRCNLSRIRIMNKFNIKKMINLYNKTWKNILIKVN